MESHGHIFTKEVMRELDRFADAAVFLYDYPKGQFFYANSFTENLLGYPAQDFLEKGVSYVVSFMHPESMAQISQDLATMIQLTSLKDKRLIHHDIFECKMRHADGHWLWTQLDTYLISFNEAGNPHYFIFVLTDIDSRKKSEEYLWDELSRRIDSKEERQTIWETFLQKKKPALHQVKLKEVADITLQTNPIRTLTEREKEVLKLISKGYSTKEMADALKISFNTIETHRKHLLDKFKVKNTAELIKEASKSYWLGH
jgi:PAS domain S-box-containing protein